MATGAYAPTGRATGPRAGFWRRFGAVFIDGILLSIVTVILFELLKAGGYALGSYLQERRLSAIVEPAAVAFAALAPVGLLAIAGCVLLLPRSRQLAGRASGS